MNTMKCKNAAAVILSAVLALSLTACSPSGTTEVSSSTASDPAVSSAAPSEVSSEPVSSEPVSSASSSQASSEAVSSETASSAPASSAAPAPSSEAPAPSSEAPAPSSEAPVPSKAEQKAAPVSSEAPPPASEPEPASSEDASSEEAAPTAAIVSACGGEEGELERKLFDKINDKRVELGLSPLQWSDAYHTAANIRCKELPYLYEHTRPDGTDWYTVLKEVGLPSYPARENLVYGKDAAFSDMDTVVDALYNGWIESPGHYANLTAADVNAAGMCVIYNGSDVYAVQEFGKQ